MNCKQIEQLLGPYLDEELRPEEQQVVAEHLTHCRTCQDIYTDLRNIKRQIQALPNIAPPERVRSNVMATVRRGRKPNYVQILGRTLNLACGVASIVLLLAGSLILFRAMAEGHPADPAMQNVGNTQAAQSFANAKLAPTVQVEQPTPTLVVATPTQVAAVSPSPIPPTLAVMITTPDTPTPTRVEEPVQQNTPVPEQPTPTPTGTPTPLRLAALYSLETMPPQPLSGQVVWLWANHLMATGQNGTLASPVADLDAKDLLVSPDGKLVAYITRNTSGKGDDLFVMRVDGKSNQRIYSADQIRGLIWTLDNRGILVFSGKMSDGDQLHLTRISLYPAVSVTHNYKIIAPWAYWSPNRNMIAFINDEYSNAKAIVVMDVNSGKVLNKLSVNSLIDGYIDWSSDSKHINFASTRAANQSKPATSIWRLTVGAAQPELLYSAPDLHIWHPTTSYDGKYTLFFAQPAHAGQDVNQEGTNELWLLDNGTKTAQRIIQPLLPTHRISNIYWSGDNKRFAYIEISNDDSQLGLNVYTSSITAQPADLPRALTAAPLPAQSLIGWQWVP